MFLAIILLLHGVSSQVSLTSSEYDQRSQTTSYVYSVEAVQVNSWTLGLESCPEISLVSTIPATTLDIKLDPQTSISELLVWKGDFV
eukprot:TRINITY_DN7861_c0_g1_i1.p1 TRINITY_DN7861_c0_g1~~TRINITY_DN7861_c0_g1_i1.p1  ORF type:complete len:87 (-),score=7.23 TRINITY_DN7861_c0_g1_i1:151-411(-)